MQIGSASLPPMEYERKDENNKAKMVLFTSSTSLATKAVIVILITGECSLESEGAACELHSSLG